MSTTSFLDDTEKIKALDTQKMYEGVESLADQIRHAWIETQKIDTHQISDVQNVVIAGMGGSGLGADIVHSAFKERLSVPFELVHDYTLPQYINEKTLVILISVSGSTEETLEATKEAHTHKAQIAIITQDGDLLKLAQQEQYVLYQLKMDQNPCSVSRTGVGYTIMGTIGLLNKLEIISLSEHEVDEIITSMISVSQQADLAVDTDKNPAKTLAFQLIDRRPILVTADFLEGAVHTAVNQLHENAKIFADYLVIPELNHHLLEGLRFPGSNVHDHIFLMIKSDQYHPRNVARLELTQQIVDQYEIETLAINLETPSKLTQVFEVITLFSYVSFYVAMLEKIDPAPLPKVDWFKKELAKI